MPTIRKQKPLDSTTGNQHNQHQSMNTSSSFCRLPAELKIQIIKDPDLSFEDISYLRVTCKEILPYATEYLARSRLTNMRFHLGRFGLSAYKRFIKSPLGRHLRLALFSDQRIPNRSKPNCIHQMKRLEDRGYSEKTLMVRVECGDASHRYFEKVMLMADNFDMVDIKLWPTTFGTGRVIFNEHKWDKLNIMFALAQSGCLTRIYLYNLDIPAQAFEELLEHHKDSLVEVDLTQCANSRDSWSSSLANIEDKVATLVFADDGEPRIEDRRLLSCTWVAKETLEE